jgi:LacI family transcriptional regulator
MERVAFPEEISIDKSSPIPRHYQISQTIKELLRLENRQKGDYLPSERKLAEIFVVSPLTIRRALNNLVEEGILEKEWGKGAYVKRPVVPKTQAVRKIGITIGYGQDVMFHPGMTELIRGVKEVLDERGYGLDFLYVTPEIIKDSSYAENWKSDLLEGVIVTTQEIPDEDMKKIEKDCGCVVFSRGLSRYNSVTFNWKEATGQIVKHLVYLGHRRIGMVGGPADYTASIESLIGYTEVLQDEGIDVDRKLIKSGNYSYQNGFYLSRAILTENRGVTAVILADDFMALGALDALRRMELFCPGDVSIVAFHDFPFSATTHPALTTMRFSLLDMGRYLAGLLLDVIRYGGKREGKEIKGELIIRESTGPVRKQD